jgi:acyl-CoA dehydrogenase
MRAMSLALRLDAFMREHIYPNEDTYAREIAEGSRWEPTAIVESLKQRAKREGLWNLFRCGLTLVEYAPLCESMGRSSGFAPEVFNCSAPDTGNMEVLAQFGTDEQKGRWLEPLLDGAIRSCFAMSEPDVASSDATNLRAALTADGGGYVLNGRKWFVSGAGHPRCAVAIVMARSDERAPRHRQHSLVLVPMDAPGVRVGRMLTVLGYDHAPHGHAEVEFDRVRVERSQLLGPEGAGFEIGQARLGPGRVHHCMRLIGAAERALESMRARVKRRVAFGRPLSEQGTVRADVAECRIAIDQARLLTLETARAIDAEGPKAARKAIAMIKIAVPRMATFVLDRAIQAHGAAGVSADFPLAAAWAQARATRILDGPDEVHRETIARLELAGETE